MKELMVIFGIVSLAISGCSSSSSKTPDGTSLVVVKHKKHSSEFTAKTKKHKSQDTQTVDNIVS